MTVADDAEKCDIVAALLDAGMIGASQGMTPSEIADSYVSSRGFMRILDALMDALGEKRQDPGIRKFVIAVAQLLDKCASVDDSVTDVMDLWRVHAWNPKAPAYLRDAVAALRLHLWADFQALRESVEAREFSPPEKTPPDG